MLTAAAVLYVGTLPLLEPLRREHDSPLTCELLPFGFAALTWMHVVAAALLTTAIGSLGVAAALTLTGDASRALAAVAVVPAVACATVLVIADRVRQPTNLAEIITRLPAGATGEVLGFAVAGQLLQPLVAMAPLAVPFGAVMAAPALPFPAGPLVLASAALALVLLALRGAGLWLWLDRYELALSDADLLEPTSSITLAWTRIRSRLAK